MQGSDNPKPGWYPDPDDPSKQKYWDGSQWTDQRTVGVPSSKGSGSGFIDAYRRLPTWAQIGIPIFPVLVIIVAATGGGESNQDDTTDKASTTPAEATASDDTTNDSTSTEKMTGSSVLGGDPSENASDDNTPSVGWNGSVEVDTLRWRLRDAHTDKAIGEQQYGLGAKANGLYIIVDLSVTNNKSESVTLTSENVSLTAGEDTYSADTNAETALIAAGTTTLFLEDLGPGVSLNGTVAFDVAPSVLGQDPQLRFNELGFGDTHGYITLPPLSG